MRSDKMAKPRILDVALEIHALMRHVEAPDGVQRILATLGNQLDSVVSLVSPGGAVLDTLQEMPATVAADLLAVAGGRADAVSTAIDGHQISLLRLFAEPPHPVLVVRKNRSGEPFPPIERLLLSGSTTPLGIAWRARELQRQRRCLAEADSRNRRAIISLLEAGRVQDARRATAALGAHLPDNLRVHLVECLEDLETAFTWCERVTGALAWIVKLPIERRLILITTPSDADCVVDTLRARASNDRNFWVASSQTVSIGEFGSAYQQAVHALFIARRRSGRYASFNEIGELADMLTGLGSAWANRVLSPLIVYRPPRSQNPNSQALRFTLGSWLRFENLAARHLRIHRNTLTARLRLIASLLHVDLSDASTCAHLSLAMKLVGPGGYSSLSLNELLSRPEVDYWAAKRLEPLRRVDRRLNDTLVTWLSRRAKINEAATLLGLSASGLRKRIMRIEQLLQQPLLDCPASRHDLFLAIEVSSGTFKAGSRGES